MIRPPVDYGMHHALILVLLPIALMAAIGCASAPKLYKRRGKPPIHRPSFRKYAKVCGSNTDGCAMCNGDGTGEIYVNPNIKVGTAHFLNVVRHEDEHIRLGCTNLDHCLMDPALLSPKDFCEGWKAHLGVEETK